MSTTEVISAASSSRTRKIPNGEVRNEPIALDWVGWMVGLTATGVGLGLGLGVGVAAGVGVGVGAGACTSSCAHLGCGCCCTQT